MIMEDEKDLIAEMEEDSQTPYWLKVLKKLVRQEAERRELQAITSSKTK